MPTLQTIGSAVAAYSNQSSTSDFTINGVDILMLEFNNARRVLERAHDFLFSEINLTLSITSAGGSLLTAYADSSVTVSGTLSPNITGAFALTGTYNGLPFYTRTVTGTVYFLAYSGTAWNITAGGFTVGADYWRLTTVATTPSGVYTAAGAYTGAATVAAVTGTVSIKRISSIQLPIADSDYLPVEFLTNDEWNLRVRRQTGLPRYNTAKNLQQLGVYSSYPVCYQHGQSIYLVPASQYTFPVLTRLDVVRFMPDYTAYTDSDFFTNYAADFLQWEALIGTNKYFKEFAEREEGNLDESELTEMRDRAFEAVINWDNALRNATSTPKAPSPNLGEIQRTQT